MKLGNNFTPVLSKFLNFPSLWPRQIVRFRQNPNFTSAPFDHLSVVGNKLRLQSWVFDVFIESTKFRAERCHGNFVIHKLTLKFRAKIKKQLEQ